MLAHLFTFYIRCAFRESRYKALTSCAGFAATARVAWQNVVTAGLAALPVLSSPVLAAEWSMTPSVRAGYEHNDNIQLTLAPHDSVQGTNISPRLDMGVRSETWGIMGSAGITRTRFSGEQNLDRDTETFSLSSLYRTERNNFALNASRVNDTTLPEDPDDPDLGRVTVQRLRRTETVQPTWSWSVTERSRLQLGYQLSEVSYAGGEDIGLFDYQQRTATATWSYLLTPRSQLFFTANHSRYRVPVISLQSQIPATGAGDSTLASDVDSKTPSFRVGMSHEFSESMQGTLMVGRRKTTSERTVQDCSYVSGTITLPCSSPRLQLTHNSGTTFSGDLKKKFDKFSVAAAASRDIAAAGSGSEVEWDSLNIQLDRPFTTRLEATLSVNGSKSRHITKVLNTTTDIKQYSVQPALQWQWTQQANLSASYRYLRLERENEDRAVYSRAIYLTFAYAWDPLSISR